MKDERNKDEHNIIASILFNLLVLVIIVLPIINIVAS